MKETPEYLERLTKGLERGEFAEIAEMVRYFPRTPDTRVLLLCAEIGRGDLVTAEANLANALELYPVAPRWLAKAGIDLPTLAGAAKRLKLPCLRVLCLDAWAASALPSLAQRLIDEGKRALRSARRELGVLCLRRALELDPSAERSLMCLHLAIHARRASVPPLSELIKPHGCTNGGKLPTLL